MNLTKTFIRLKQLLRNKDINILLGNFTSLSILQLVNYLLPFITLPYLTRVIGVDKFGILGLALALIIYLQTFVDFGFDYSATREVANNQKDVSKISKIFWTVIFTKVIFMIISFLITIILICAIPLFKENYLLILLTFLYIPGYIFFPDWFYQGLQKMQYVTVLNITAKTLFTILIFIFINEQKDYIFYPLFNALCYLFSGVISMLIITKKLGVKFYLPSLLDIKNAIKGSYDIFLNKLMPNLYNNFSTIILGFWWGNSMVGIYDAGKKVIMLSDQVITVLSRTFFPYLIKNISKHHFYVKMSLSISLIISIIFFFGANTIVRLLFSSEFYDSRIIIQIMAISPLLLAIMNAYGTNYLIIINQERTLRNITFISSIFGLLFGLLLISNFKAVGAALTVTFSRGLIACLTFYYAKKKNLNLIVK